MGAPSAPTLWPCLAEGQVVALTWKVGFVAFSDKWIGHPWGGTRIARKLIIVTACPTWKQLEGKLLMLFLYEQGAWNAKVFPCRQENPLTSEGLVRINLHPYHLEQPRSRETCRIFTWEQQEKWAQLLLLPSGTFVWRAFDAPADLKWGRWTLACSTLQLTEMTERPLTFVCIEAVDPFWLLTSAGDQFPSCFLKEGILCK